jgi:hypothetical protein
MQHDVGTEVERALKDGSREHVVDENLRAAFMRDADQRAQVDDFHQRIRGRFRPHELRVRPHRGANRIEVGHVDRRRFHLPAGKELPRDVPKRMAMRDRPLHFT